MSNRGATAGLSSSAIFERASIDRRSPFPPQKPPKAIELFYAPTPCPATPCEAIRNFILEKCRAIIYIHIYSIMFRSRMGERLSCDNREAGHSRFPGTATNGRGLSLPPRRTGVPCGAPVCPAVFYRRIGLSRRSVRGEPASSNAPPASWFSDLWQPARRRIEPPCAGMKSSVSTCPTTTPCFCGAAVPAAWAGETPAPQVISGQVLKWNLKNDHPVIIMNAVGNYRDDCMAGRKTLDGFSSLELFLRCTG